MGLLLPWLFVEVYGTVDFLPSLCYYSHDHCLLDVHGYSVPTLGFMN